MDWNAKWEWQNHDEFTSKLTTKKLQSTSCLEQEQDQAQEEEGMNEYFNLSASDVASAKSSVSASTGSSIKEASVSSGELFTGLKLGKRTYFEHSLGKSTPPLPRCQVEGCNLDLSSAKDYHKKHRVCGSHSKCPKVVISGVERRFCQQCSRFHSLAEFDEKKRSCRRRLSDHNARRRKPKHEMIQFNSTNISSSFYGFGQQLSFQSRPAATSTWGNTSNSIAKLKLKNSGIIDGISQFPNAVSIAFNRPLPSKATSFEVLNQDLKQSLSPVDIHDALSLLSNNSSGLHEPDLTKFNPDHPQPVGSDNLLVVQPQGLPPISSPDYWQSEQQSIGPLTKTGNTQLQEFQRFDRFYSNPMDEILKPL